MDRFWSNTINKVDKKGRVSIPAAFRPALGDSARVFARLSVDQPAVEAGGEAFIAAEEKRLEEMDPFSADYAAYAAHVYGETFPLSIDGEGRVVITPTIAEHCGIESEIAFVGMGRHFQMWEPSKWKAHLKSARTRVSQIRSSLARNANGLAGSGAGAVREQDV